MYDSRVRPKDGAEPVQVTANFFIASFDSISESNMDYTMNVYLRLESMVYKMVMPRVEERSNCVISGKYSTLRFYVIMEAYLPLMETYLLTI